MCGITQDCELLLSVSTSSGSLNFWHRVASMLVSFLTAEQFHVVMAPASMLIKFRRAAEAQATNVQLLRLVPRTAVVCEALQLH